MTWTKKWAENKIHLVFEFIWIQLLIFSMIEHASEHKSVYNFVWQTSDISLKLFAELKTKVLI